MGRWACSLAALAAACGGGTAPGGDPAPGGDAAESMETPRPAACPASGPCLEPWQAPVLVKSGEPHELWLRGWDLGEGGRVLLDGVEVTASKWSPTLVRVALDGAPAGDGAIRVEVGGVASNELPTLTTPHVDSIDPSPAAPGEVVVLAGAAFGTVPGRVDAKGDPSTALEVLSWSETAIEARIPETTDEGEPSGTYAVRVFRRIVRDGPEGGPTDRGEIGSAPAAFDVLPIVTSPPCRTTRVAPCFVYGKGVGSGFTVMFDGIPAKPGPTSAEYLVPPQIAPGPFTLTIVTAGGIVSEPQEGGELLAWQREPVLTKSGFGAIPGTHAVTKDRTRVVVHDKHSHRVYVREYFEYGVAPGQSCTSIENFPDDPFEMPVFIDSPGDGFVYSAPRSSPIEVEFPLQVTLMRCPIAADYKVPWEYLGAVGTPDNVSGLPGGVGVAGGAVWVLLRDVAGAESYLAKWTKGAGDPVVVQTLPALGVLVSGGGQIWLAKGDPPWTGDLWHLEGEALVPIEVPWTGDPPADPIFAVTASGALVAVLPGAGGGADVFVRPPTGGGWTLRTSIPAALGEVRAFRPHGGFDDLVLAVLPDPAGGERLQASRLDHDTGVWSPLYEDLAEVPGCPTEVERAGIYLDHASRPFAVFEMSSPGCTAQGLEPFLQATSAWASQMVEP